MAIRVKAGLLLLLFVFACTQGADLPADPIWGKQACEHCMMLVSEQRPAAQATQADGSRKFFDDVGCLVTWLESEHGSAARVWVRAPEGQGWVDARTAKYRAGQRTPMDYGFLAAREGISFQELARALRERRIQQAGAL
jgi:nitrous oxide reductase accessory protein NosL